MKDRKIKLVILSLSFLFLLAGCSATVDTSTLEAPERIEYAIKLYNDGDYDMALLELEAFIMQYPGSEFTDKAQYYLGMARFNKKQYIIAASEFSRLIRLMTASSFLAEAQYMLAECYYQLSPKYPLDQIYTKQAIQEFQAFLDVFSKDDRVAEAEAKIKELNDKLAQKEFHGAYIYEKLEYYNAAILYYDDLLSTYHDSRFAPQASYNKIQLLIKRKRFAEALKEVENYLKKYPEDKRYLDVEKIKTDLLRRGVS